MAWPKGNFESCGKKYCESVSLILRRINEMDGEMCIMREGEWKRNFVSAFIFATAGEMEWRMV